MENGYLKEVNNFINSKKKYIKIDIDTDIDGSIHINRLDAINPGRGDGRRFMNDFLSITDKHNLFVTLVVDETYNPERLYKFYSGLDFMRYEMGNLCMVHAPHITSNIIKDIHDFFEIYEKSDVVKEIKFDDEIREMIVVIKENTETNIENEIKDFLKLISKNHGLLVSYEQKNPKSVLETLRTGEKYGHNKIIEYFSSNVQEEDEKIENDYPVVYGKF